MLVTLASVTNQKDKKHEKKNIYQMVVTFSILTLAQIDIIIFKIQGLCFYHTFSLILKL